MFTTNPTSPTRSSEAVQHEGPKRDRADYMRDFMAAKRARSRDLKLPPVKDPARRAACLADPRLFLPTYFPHKYTFAFTPTQLEVVDAIREAMVSGTKKAVAIPRGDGKTSITEGMVIWGTAVGAIRFAAIIPATARMSRNILDNLKAMYEDDVFGEDFPEIVAPIVALGGEPRKAPKQTVGGRRTRINWTKDYLRLPDVAGSAASGAIIYPMSIDGAIRGLKMGNDRPDFVILDDPETAQSARSELEIGQREAVINRDVAGLKGQGMKLGVAALVTIQNSICLAARLTDRTIRPDFGGIRKGAIEEWPKRLDMWDEYCHRRRAAQEAGDSLARDACSFLKSHWGAMHEGAKLSNPNNYKRELGDDGEPLQLSALQACFDFISDNGMEAFESEYQNNPDAHGDGETTRLTARVVESRTNELEKGSIGEGCIGMTTAIDVGKYAGHWIRVAFYDEARFAIESYGVAEVRGTSTMSTAGATERAVVAMLHEWREQIANVPPINHEGEPAQHQNGQPFLPTMGFVDSGDGVLMEAIYSFVRSVAGTPGVPIGASKGYGDGQRNRRLQAPSKLPNGKSAKRISGTYWHADYQHEHGLYLYQLDANFWKRFVHARFATAPFTSEDGSQTPYSIAIHRADVMRQHQTFAKHITAEEYQERFVQGRGMVRGWAQVSANNHWLDATYMSLALGCALNFFRVDPAPQLSAPSPAPRRARGGSRGPARSFGRR